METNKVLSSLCYFSIFFAGFIFPIVVYFVSDDRELKDHAKSALLSHLLPFLSFVAGIILVITTSLAGGEPSLLFILFFVIIMAINVIVVIWNIVKGIQVLR
ncbi:DUF4870 domain-containing protein [Bacillus solimangrovi]|uniref:DUF4870 domain-containing protein n=1 Tax=Bacillus solimangrovi TaxID=1305675 RepID=A0A1E5LDT9_9BACI|nr:DUF4870 domain-containing protein [Bacillus solimangrovi]OEH92234.1 hypothetical protein BFG57_02910 [Bacillus solimangrovi]